MRAVSAVGLTLATMPHAQVKVELTQEDGVVTSFVRDYQDLSGIPDVDLPIPAGPLQTQRLRIEIRQNGVNCWIPVAALSPMRLYPS